VNWANWGEVYEKHKDRIDADLAAAPPLSEAQKDRLAAIFATGRPLPEPRKRRSAGRKKKTTAKDD
jgi:hypothetical protein